VPPLRHLSPRSAEILRAVVVAIRPRGHGFDQPIEDDVLLEIDRTVPYLPPLLRLAFPLGLRLLEWGPLFFVGEPTRLTRMEPERALAYCERWLHGRLPQPRMLMLGVRALVYLAFFQHPSVLDAMEVRWDRRMLDAVRLRAETLDHARTGDGR
jgi:hypothetical protein